MDQANHPDGLSSFVKWFQAHITKCTERVSILNSNVWSEKMENLYRVFKILFSMFGWRSWPNVCSALSLMSVLISVTVSYLIRNSKVQAAQVWLKCITKVAACFWVTQRIWISLRRFCRMVTFDPWKHGKSIMFHFWCQEEVRVMIFKYQCQQICIF